MTAIAQEIWSLSEKYIALADVHLLRGFSLDGPARGVFPMRTEMARLHFLFPGFPEATIKKLIVLRNTQWFVECARANEQAGSVQASVAAERQEANYAKVRDDLKTFADGVSRAQREILLEKYFGTVE